MICPNFMNLYTLPVTMAPSSSEDSSIHCVLPVLWMSSCFHIMTQIQVQAIGKLFTVTRKVATGTKSALDDYLVFVDV